MAQFVYKNIKEGKILNVGDIVMLYHQEYKVKESVGGYYLQICDNRKGNDWIFNHLGIENKYDFCGEPDSNGEIFPYKDTLEELTHVIKKLWEYMPLKIGDRVLVRKIEADNGIPYKNSVYVTKQMEMLSNSYITTESISFEECVQNDVYGVYVEIYANGYYWSADLLDFTDIILANVCIKAEDITALKHQPIPSNNILQTKIQIPKKNKNLKVNL